MIWADTEEHAGLWHKLDHQDSYFTQCAANGATNFQIPLENINAVPKMLLLLEGVDGGVITVLKYSGRQKTVSWSPDKANATSVIYPPIPPAPNGPEPDTQWTDWVENGP